MQLHNSHKIDPSENFNFFDNFDSVCNITEKNQMQKTQKETIIQVNMVKLPSHPVFAAIQ